MVNQILSIPTIYWVVMVGLLVTGVSAFFIKKNVERRKLGVKIGGAIFSVGFVFVILILLGVQGSFMDKLKNPLFNQTQSYNLGNQTLNLSYSITPQGTSSNSGAGASPSQQYVITTNPTPTVTGYNSQYPGTTFSTTARISTNKGAWGAAPSTVVPGQTLDLNLNASGYHNAVIKNLLVKADTFPLSTPMNKNASVTITAFNTNNEVIDGAATNQSVTAGQSPSMSIKFNGQSQANTQDMTCILEESNKTAIDSVKGITMAGGTERTIPLNFYTLAGVDSYTKIYDIPALTDSSDVFHSVTVNTATTSGYSLAGSTLKIDCYTKENFEDSATGQLAFDIQDSAGVLKSMAHYSKTIVFQ